jgi:hypothetical protein
MRRIRGGRSRYRQHPFGQMSTSPRPEDLLSLDDFVSCGYLIKSLAVVRRTTSRCCSAHLGGKSLNNFSISLSSFFVCFLGLSGKASVAQPRHKSCLCLSQTGR